MSPAGAKNTREQAVLERVESIVGEMVAFLQEITAIPTVNPPGENYTDCAERIGTQLQQFGYEVHYVPADGRPEHTSKHPRMNVFGTLRDAPARPALHFNGHFDVVPAGTGWTVDPFGGVVDDGKIFGRGTTDQKAGIAASIFAIEAIRRAGVRLNGCVQQSGTVDEESGGFAGMAYLAQNGYVARDRTDYVIITEPLNVDRVCLGHKGVYWFEVVTRGRIAHGSMPFLGVSAIDGMGRLLEAVRSSLRPALATRRTAVPVVPPGARQATININGIEGGQKVDGIQTPCVADLCRAVFDRRFLIEEGFEQTKREIETLIERVAAAAPDVHFGLRDLMVVHPTQTPSGSALVDSLERSIARVLGRRAQLIASPGTYDHKHVARIGGIEQCVAYGPGELELAHQPDEYCDIEDMVNATKVIALTLLDLLGAAAA